MNQVLKASFASLQLQNVSPTQVQFIKDLKSLEANAGGGAVGMAGVLFYLYKSLKDEDDF